MYGIYEAFFCGWVTDGATERRIDRGVLLTMVIGQTILLCGYLVPFVDAMALIGVKVNPPSADEYFAPAVIW